MRHGDRSPASLCTGLIEEPTDASMQNRVDYLFASKDLATSIDEVVEIRRTEWESYGDHRPIVVRFRA